MLLIGILVLHIYSSQGWTWYIQFWCLSNHNGGSVYESRGGNRWNYGEKVCMLPCSTAEEILYSCQYPDLRSLIEFVLLMLNYRLHRTISPELVQPGHAPTQQASSIITPGSGMLAIMKKLLVCRNLLLASNVGGSCCVWTLITQQETAYIEVWKPAQLINYNTCSKPSSVVQEIL